MLNNALLIDIRRQWKKPVDRGRLPMPLECLIQLCLHQNFYDNETRLYAEAMTLKNQRRLRRNDTITYRQAVAVTILVICFINDGINPDDYGTMYYLGAYATAYCGFYTAAAYVLEVFRQLDFRLELL